MATAPQIFQARLGAELPLAYGYARVEGNRILVHELTNKTRIVFILLGEGEWDGIERLWINRKIVNHADTSLVHFHPGLDGILGDGLTAVSTGGDQKVDAFFSDLPLNVQRLTYSRIAYIALKVPHDPAAVSEDLEVLGDYRTTKCRIFDAAGTQTSYAFTTNSAWQIHDKICRTMVAREFNINAGGITALTAAEKARFDFPSFKDTADYNDADIGGGIKRWESSVAFPARVSLTQALEQLLVISRSYLLEDGGVIYLRSDKPRAFSFTLKADHVEPGSFDPSKSQVRGAANHFEGEFRDLKTHALATIDTVGNSGAVRAANVATIKTTQAHGLKPGAIVAIQDVTDATFNNSAATVVTVPSNILFTYANAGSNTTSGGGTVGQPESRFASRMKPVDHEEHQAAVGQRGLGLTLVHKRTPLAINFGNSRAHQVERVLKFLAVRHLGQDAAPYKAPWEVRVRASRYAVDDSNNALLAQQPGDIIKLHSSVSEEYQGDYELLEKEDHPLGDDDGGAGFIDLYLKEYVSTAFTDVFSAEQGLNPTIPWTPPDSPAAPTIAQTVLPIAGGAKFKFVLAGETAAFIQHYKIWRNTTNDAGTAVVIDNIPNSIAASSLEVTFQDSELKARQEYHYWVSCVNTSQVESAKAYAGSTVPNFSVPVEAVNLFGNPETTGAGNLPSLSSATVEQWQFQATQAEYRNAREIRLPKNSGGGASTASQYKSIRRFRPGSIVTLAFEVRRGNVVGSPTGTFVIQIARADTDGGGLPGGDFLLGEERPNVVDLSPTSHKRYKVTASLALKGGQGFWLFNIANESTDEDLYITEPLLNPGSDAAPFTKTTLLADITQFAYEGFKFVEDAFTNSNGTAITAHLPTVAGAKWAETLEGAGGGSCQIQSNKAELVYTEGSGDRFSLVRNRLTAETPAYYVQAGLNVGNGTGVNALDVGVTARMVDANNFYLAVLHAGGLVELFKRVSGTYTSLGTFSSGSNTGTIKLQVTDAAKKVFVDGTERISSSDNALTSAGAPGFWFKANATTTSDDPDVENLVAAYVQNVAAPPAPPATPPSPPDPPNFDPDREPGGGLLGL